MFWESKKVTQWKPTAVVVMLYCLFDPEISGGLLNENGSNVSFSFRISRKKAQS